MAVTRDWIAADGNWSEPSNWMPTGVPTSGDVVSIGFADGVARTVNYDYSVPLLVLASLDLDLTGAGTDATILSMSSADFLAATNEFVGRNGRGVIGQLEGDGKAGTFKRYFNVRRGRRISQHRLAQFDLEHGRRVKRFRWARRSHCAQDHTTGREGRGLADDDFDVACRRAVGQHRHANL